MINNTCNSLFSKQLYERTSEEKKYLGLMVTFIILFLILMVAVILFFVRRWKGKKRKEEQIPIELRSENVIVSVHESSRNNTKSIADSSSSSKSKKEKPRMVVSVLDNIQKRRNSVQGKTE